MRITVALVDDHVLLLKSLSNLFSASSLFEVCIEASDGRDLQRKILLAKCLPDIILIDVSMPVMCGHKTAEWLSLHYPSIHLVALSMHADDRTIMKMRDVGCCAYLLKDTHPEELFKAMTAIYQQGYYAYDISRLNHRRISEARKAQDIEAVSPIEREFLEYVGTDMTYREIAAKMRVSQRTVEAWRDSLFVKLNVQSRVGLCMEALRRNITSL